MTMQSEQINELATALSKAQSEIQGAKKDCANPFFKSKYADLSSVWDACREPLTKNGLSVIQTTGERDGKQYLYTLLAHSSGQWIKSEMVILLGKPDIQSLGSAITYSRRYSLAMIAGVCPEDDDGNAAVKPEPAPIAKIGPGQAKILLDLVEQCPSDYQQNFFAHIRNTPISAQKISDIPLSHFETLKMSLQRKASEKQQEKQDDRL